MADAQVSAAEVTVPVLVVGNTADDACTPSHTHRIYDAVAHEQKVFHEVMGATHYYGGENGRAHLVEAIETVTTFLSDQLPS